MEMKIKIIIQFVKINLEKIHDLKKYQQLKSILILGQCQMDRKRKKVLFWIWNNKFKIKKKNGKNK